MTSCLSSDSSTGLERVPFAQPDTAKKLLQSTLRHQAVDALYALGNGRFQFIAAIILGLANCSDSVEVRGRATCECTVHPFK